jgi:O-antigen/teichoic acid export membrane protein
MNNVGTSLLNNQRSAGGDDYRRVFWWNLGLTATIVVLGAGTVIAMGPLLLRVFGQEFQGGYGVLRILMLAAVIESVAIWTYQVIQSHGRMWLTLFAVTLPRDCLILALAYGLTPVYGAAGLAAAHVGGWVLALAAISILTYRTGLDVAAAESRWQAGVDPAL